MTRDPHERLVADVAEHLDLGTGLHAITGADPHATLVADLACALDVEVGLAAIACPTIPPQRSVAMDAAPRRRSTQGLPVLVAGLVALLVLPFFHDGWTPVLQPGVAPEALPPSPGPTAVVVGALIHKELSTAVDNSAELSTGFRLKVR
ncbi:hypothetical protein [Actinokineospora sp. NBRC 105648]|uniref:hypothetical protein n=1 Tax=Actinokineospora sp. NBRC 105648 TaxID=3032206 RepID=UPI0024A329B5|nr:hypothetical protein [Actinokineospora sp. NBRC 105648]GLZ41295.1 hypothetical protein Acsp05_49190 [Actinokineospora sp. NBRC 105648]